MNIDQIARKIGQVRFGGPVRISVLDVSEMLGEPGKYNPPNGSNWVASTGSTASGHMLDLEFAARPDVGRGRNHNSDYLGYSSPATPPQGRSHGGLFVLAPGVGGPGKREGSSTTAAET